MNVRPVRRVRPVRPVQGSPTPSRITHHASRPPRERASTFIIVLWISFGLVGMALYFGHAMHYELRASDNRVSGQAAEQAVEGAVRYINNLLAFQSAYGSNGISPDLSSYVPDGAAVGDARFWLIGRDTNTLSGQGLLSFGLVDEASKVNLNTASSNILAALVSYIPNANQDLAAAVLDWRSTNSAGTFQSYYSTSTQGYQTKGGAFDTVEELRLVYAGDYEALVGEDLNRNGVLDPNETDLNHNGQLDPGLFEYVTVYSREPNTYSNGTARVNIRTVTATGPLPTLLNTVFGSTRAGEILINLRLRQFSGQPAAGTQTFRSPLDLYTRSRMSADEFAQIANCITVTNGNYIEGRVNVNTASATVLACLPGLDSTPEIAQTLVTYRETNPDKLGSVAWVADALAQNTQNTNSVLNTLVRYDCITAQSYQFSADVAAVGPNGRGYRRIRFVFDTSDGSPKVVYRQDLTHLGWALGKELRDNLVLAKNTR